MSKRRTSRQTTANKETKTALAAARNVALCAAFQEAYAKGGTIQENAKALGIATRTAYRWASDVKITLSEHIRRICSDSELARRWDAQYKSTRGKSRTRVLELVTRIRDGFPVPIPVPPVGPVTLIFTDKVEMYEGEDFSAAREISIERSVQDEPQGNAGSRASESPSAGSRLLNPAQGRE